MHRFGACLLAGCDDFIGLQVAFLRRHAAKADSLVSKLYMLCVAINVGMNGDCFNAHGTRCADDPTGNFAAIGNQNFFKHHHL